MVRLPFRWTNIQTWIHLVWVFVFCVSCFYGWIWVYNHAHTIRIFFTAWEESLVSGEVEFVNRTDIPDIQRPLAVKNFLETRLKPSIDTDNPGNKDSTYKQTRQKILSEYESGKRDPSTIQSYLYLTSLEQNNAWYNQAAKEWCEKNETECLQAKSKVTFSGTVTDDTQKPIVGARVFVSGEEKNSALTDKNWAYTFSFTTLNPRRIRIVVHHPDFAGGAHTVVTFDPSLLDAGEQLFEKNFTLTRAVQSIIVDTSKKKVMRGSWVTVEKNWFLITNDFSKYLVPFDAIKTPDKKPYTWQVAIRVFEFDRKTANEFLNNDVFDEVYGFASEGLITFSMPLIFFYDTKGQRLEVFKDNPMTVWTTNRELKALIDEMSMRPDMPGFNPAEYDEGSSPENIAKKIKEDELLAYQESQKDPLEHPLTHSWLLEHFSRLPGFFVFDQSTGSWDNTGFALVAPSTDVKHSIRAHFWTKK